MAIRKVARWLRIATTAWLVSGLTCGIGARVAMRVVALTDSTPGTAFTLGGTVGILIAVMMATAPFSLLFMAVRRMIPGSPFRRGLVFGAALLGVMGPVFFLFTADEIVDLGIPALNAVVFGSLFPLYGVTVSWTVHRLESRTQDPATPTRSPSPALPVG